MNIKMTADVSSSLKSSGKGEINSSQYSVDYYYDQSSIRAIVKFSEDQAEHVQVREVGLRKMLIGYVLC